MNSLPSSSDLLALLPKLHHCPVLVIGDVMLDSYLRGDAERISPEAPVPVVLVDSEEHLLGGSGNVARNIVSLGGQATLAGLIGHDASGQKVQTFLHEQNIISAIIPTASRPTTCKVRVLARQQQMLRLDYEKSTPLTPEDLQLFASKLQQLLPSTQTIILSDYNKGLICPDFMSLLHSLIQPQHKLLIDPKPKNLPLYSKPFLLTPNTKEASECAGIPIHTTQDIIAAGRKIFSKTNCTHLLITLGSGGMALFLTPDQIWHIPTVAQAVFDVTGAGDTVIATLGLALAAGIALLPACILANYAAGLVVAQVGAGVVTPPTLAQAIQDQHPLNITQWVSNSI